MRILTFEFEDKTTGWHLQESSFDAFNLLVGVSGVGKTRILKALEVVQWLALGYRPPPVHACSWTIQFEAGGRRYTWSAETEPATGFVTSATGEVNLEPRFKTEELRGNEETPLISRTPSDFSFRGKSIPLLTRTASSIFLLGAEEEVSPIRRAFEQIWFERHAAGMELFPVPVVEDLQRGCVSREDVSRTPTNSPQLRAYLLQNADPSGFAEIRDLFIDVVPSVRDVRVEAHPRSDGLYVGISVEIQETDVPGWIPSGLVSAGMLRTWTLLLELSLAPTGSVVVIDEVENSLGVNCLGPVVDFLLSRAPDLQFILTSHHPYVIHNLPFTVWKLVRRHGTDVHLLSARDIPALHGSHHDKFHLLLNLPEYEKGIS